MEVGDGLVFVDHLICNFADLEGAFEFAKIISDCRPVFDGLDFGDDGVAWAEVKNDLTDI